jgi:hypothetical protein
MARRQRRDSRALPRNSGEDQEPDLEHFFSDAYLRKYFATRTRSVDWKKYMKTRTSSGAEGRGPLGSYVDAQWQKLASPK